MESRAYKMLENLNVIHELGRQRCFELGNPYYFKDIEDEKVPGNEKGNYYRKELYTGEMFLVTLEVKVEKDKSYTIKDTIIRKIK